MALNMGGRGFGFTLWVRDVATPALTNFLGKVAKSPSQISPLFGSLGRLGGSFAKMTGMAGSAVSAIGGLAASLGPLAIAIGVVVFAFMEFNDIAMRSEEIIKSGIDTYARYETSLKEVGTILHATAGELDDLGSTAREMGVTFGTDVTQQLRGFYQTVSAGFADYKQSAEIMDTANRLAVAGVTDITSSVELLTGTIKSFGLEASDATEVSNVLFKTVEKARTTVGELAHSFAMVAPIAAISGASLEETTAALSAITVTGMPTRQSITALAGLFRSLTKITPEAQKALDKYGIELDAARIKNEGLLPILQDIQAATGGNVAALREIIREEEGFRAAAILTGEQLGHYVESLEYFQTQQDAVGVAFEDMSKNLEFQRRQFQEFHQELRTQIGEIFAPYIGMALELANKLFESLMKLPKPIQNIAFGMAGLALSMPVIAKHGLGLIWTLMKLVVVGGLATTMLTMMAAPLLLLAQLFAPLIAASAALALAWETDFKGIRTFVIETWAKIKAAGLAAWETLKVGIQDAVDALRTAFPYFDDMVAKFIKASEKSIELGKNIPIEGFIKFGENAGQALSKTLHFLVGVVIFTKILGKSIIKIAKVAFWPIFASIWAVKKAIDAVLFVIDLLGPHSEKVALVLKIAFWPVWLMFKAIKAAIEGIMWVADKLGPILKPIIEAFVIAGGGGVARAAPAATPAAPATRVGALPPAVAAITARAPGEQRGPGVLSPIEIKLLSELNIDGDKMGEKTNRFLLDLQSKEMIAEPAV